MTNPFRATRYTALALSVTCLALLGLPAPAAPPAAPVPPDHAAKMAQGTDLFTKHVRAILVENCLKCHGGNKTQKGFDISTRELFLKGGENGPVVEVGKAKDSRLYDLIRHKEMPYMPSKEDKLSEDKIAKIAEWIDLGAPYDKPLIEKATTVKKAMVVTDDDRKFWSFQPLKRSPVPDMKDAGWCRTPVDRFIVAKLNDKGLSPNPAADRRTLIRRAYFDLIGLPPEPAEVEKFVNDPDPHAYEKLVDKLLASPQHGERWARHWLDLARFAESHGFEHDYDRPTAYHYRDFVIKALNADLPYDKFVKWQIAGDEYEPDNPLALMATGFLAAGVHSTQITKNQVEKERYDELDDMSRTVGTAMLGLTVGCARCHDHKYDPIPTRDYYRLLSTFTTTVRSEVELNLDPDATRLARAQFDKDHAPLAEAVTRYEKDELPKRLDQYLAGRKKESKPLKWQILDLVSYQSQGGATLTKQDDGSVLATGKNPDFDTYTFVVHTKAKGITAVRLEALADPSLVKSGPGRAGNGNFALSDFRVTAAALDKKTEAVAVKLVSAKATFEQPGLPVKAAIDDDKKSAWAVDPQFGKNHAAVFETEGEIGFDSGTVLTFTLSFNNNNGHQIGRPRLSLTTLPRPVSLDGDALPAGVQAVFVKLDTAPEAKLSDDERGTLLKWYRTRDPQWQQLNKKVEEHNKSAPKAGATKVLISTEGLPAVRLHTQGGDFLEQTHFLKRGDPNQKEEVATPGFLQVLMPNPEQEKRWQTPPPSGWRTSYRRRALAEWMTDVDHGGGHLLARVIVNRLWQHHMGVGIVGTPSDFGFQGDRPTHPELLDYLASELIEHGWSLKHIHKLIMTSAVYTQSTHFDKEKAKLDEHDRLYWRRVPHRLEAEAIRDSLLAVSGTLDPKPFGPGTLDANMKRRSIYFFVKRSQMMPTMVLFDGPDTLQGLEQRGTTTIAPQSLLLMNNGQVRSCAESFAKRINPKEGLPPADVVRAAYARALGRQPKERELTDSMAFLKEQTESYKATGKGDAHQLALTDFCQALLGLNEFIYID